MSWGFVIAGAATVVGSAISADAAGDAADSQAQAAANSQAANDDKFRQLRELLAPYVAAGNQGLGGQQALLGLSGAPAQQTAINGLSGSPLFSSLVQQGENAILQNASATGGLRGGNTQAELGQFRPAMLQSVIDKQISNLGGLTSIGQNAAAGVGNAGMQTGALNSNLMQQQGAAIAGGQIAQGNSLSNGIGSLAGLFSSGLRGSGSGEAFPTGGMSTTPALTQQPNYGWGKI